MPESHTMSLSYSGVYSESAEQRKQDIPHNIFKYPYTHKNT